ncbi:hypothetical protein JST99_05025 [Candidatus Dependentiae bacterium]|nr:hypothetical protein [Candidatus Dependentiae bacterium]MCC7415278.1 hypothetical protein [Campylobacterota bacterium]
MVAKIDVAVRVTAHALLVKKLPVADARLVHVAVVSSAHVDRHVHAVRVVKNRTLLNRMHRLRTALQANQDRLKEIK